jgi:hypothetical protein
LALHAADGGRIGTEREYGELLTRHCYSPPGTSPFVSTRQALSDFHERRRSRNIDDPMRHGGSAVSPVWSQRRGRRFPHPNRRMQSDDFRALRRAANQALAVQAPFRFWMVDLMVSASLYTFVTQAWLALGMRWPRPQGAASELVDAVAVGAMLASFELWRTRAAAYHRPNPST